MDQETRQALLNTCSEIERTLDGAQPTPDPGRLARLAGLCEALSGHSIYLSEKARELSGAATMYFSARKHDNRRGGADALMQEMRYRLLDSMREEIDRLSRQQPWGER